MSKVTVPESIEASASGSEYITGKVSLVSTQQGLNVIGVAGGQNPGQYTISAKVTGGLDAALSALNSQADVWGVIENNEVITFSVYAK